MTRRAQPPLDEPPAGVEASPGRRIGSGSIPTAAAAVLIGRACQSTVSLGATAVLARLLTKGDFGLMFMALALFSLAGPIVDFGLPHAAVHHAPFQGATAAAVFRANAILSLAVAFGGSLAAPVVAAFFSELAVVAPMIAISWAAGAAMACNLHVALLRHRMRFPALALTEAVSASIGAAAAVALAFGGAGVWALVVQFSILRVGPGLGALWMTRWWPGFRPTASAAVADVAAYARDVTLVRLVGSASRNLDMLVVGRLAGDAALGVYRLAFRWSRLPVESVGQPLLNVAVSALSRVRRSGGGRDAAYAAGFRLGLEGMLSVSIPAAMFLMLESELVVAVVLGAGWADAAPVLRALALATACWPIQQAAKWAFLGEGRTAAWRRVTWITAPMTAAVIVVGGALGGADVSATIDTVDAATAVPIAVAWAASAAALLAALPTVIACTADSELRPVDFVRPMIAPAGAAALGLGVWSLSDAPPLRPVSVAAAFSIVLVPRWIGIVARLRRSAAAGSGGAAS